MSCSQNKQLSSFPRSRIQKKWFRYFNDHKDFRNDGTLHLFSLMALYSYADFRSNTRVINRTVCQESPGQWICKASSLPRILRARSKVHALELMEHFQKAGFLDYEWLDGEAGIIRYTIRNWQKHCTHLEYNYYSYKGSGFFFFPLPAGRKLISLSRRNGMVVFSELDAIMDLWLHTVLNDPAVSGSEYMPVVYFPNMSGKPLLSYTYLATRWGWSKSRVGRFILKAEEAGIISRVSFSSSRGSVISPCGFREMIYGESSEQLQLQRIGELLGIAQAVQADETLDDIKLEVESRVSNRTTVFQSERSVRIQVFRTLKGSFFARPSPLIFYSSSDWGMSKVEDGTYRGPPKSASNSKGGG